MSSARVLCAVYILLVLSAVAFCTNPSVTCGTGTCPANSGCCVWSPPGSPQINQCYDTNLFTCTNDQSLSGQQCLCATNQQCCNKACFNPATFSCVQNYGNNGPTCLCTPGQGCCNGQCFNTNIFFCVLADNKPGKRCLCQVGAHDRCYYNFSNDQQTCYNSNTQTVCNNQIVDINSIARITITSTPSQNCNQPTTLTCTATGNFAPYSYQWTASGGGTISGPSNVMTISATSSGTYTCTVTGTNNCPVSKSTTITTPTCCSASITASPSTPTCETPVSLQCNPSGTTGAVTYQWTTAGGAIQGPTNTQVITATQTGSYTCSITDASACTASASQSVTISKLGVTVTPNPANACSGPVSLTCNPSNAAGPVSYQWTASGGGVISGSTTSQSISATATGTYTCTATDTICTKSASSTVNIGSINVFVVPPTANGCAGAPQTFTCNAITNNGPVTYQWVASNGGVIAGPVTTQSIIATTTGTYTCTATDTNGCSGSASGNAVISNAQVSISGPLSVCNVASSPLTCNVANAVGPVVYNWVASNGGTIGGPNNGQVIQALTTGTYTCTATDSSQCPVQASVPFVLSNPIVSVQKITPGCTAPATLSCTVSGPVTGPVVYFWTGPGIVGPNNQMTVQVNAPGLYTCSAGSATCQDQASLSVSVSPISATVVPPTANTCGQSAQFTCQAAGAFGPVTYAWTASGGGSISGPTTTQTITALTTGTYTCVVTDSGCSATASGTLNTNSCDCTNFELHIAPQYGSTENTGAEAVLNFDFNQVGANAVLTLLITNVAASTQSTLVGVAFDIPAGAPTPTYQSLGSSFDKFWIDPDLPPFGTFDIGTSPDRPTFAGGNPQTGLTNGQQTTVQFTFANTNAQTLATNFYNGFLSEELRATGRFQQVGPNQEGSDKVLGGGVECLN